MSILSKHFEFVKAHIAVQEKLARKFAPDSKFSNPGRYQLHSSNIERFEELFGDLERADADLDHAQRHSHAPRGPIQLQLMPHELDGLPQELIEELSVQSVDKLEMSIFTALSEAGGILSLDRLLISVFRKTGEVHKRSAITAKIYRMIQKGTLYSVPFRKGWYSLNELSEEEANDIFSAAGGEKG